MSNPLNDALFPQALKDQPVRPGGSGRVHMSATGNDLCPVAAILEYVAVRGNSPGPFFRFVDETPRTKARFILHVRDVLTRAGLP